MDNYLINSIYRATEGEGINIGIPQVFIRYQGCAIFCKNCDSKDTWKFSETHKMSLAKILELTKAQSENGKGANLKRVSITGGDPLDLFFRSGLLKLIKSLKNAGYYINLEAAGNQVAKEVFELIDFISFDYKTPSTGVDFGLSPLKDLYKNYLGKFQVKSVVSNVEDFNSVEKARAELEREFGFLGFSWCITPEINPKEDFMADKFKQALSFNESVGAPFRVIGQQHKWVYGADAKQV